MHRALSATVVGAVGQRVDVEVRRVGTADLVEQAGHREAFPLARRALPARLDGQEAFDPVRDRDDIVRSSMTMNPAAPSPLPASRIASYVSGVSSADAGMNALATPRQHRDDLPTVLDATADLVDRLAQRRAHRDLGDGRAPGRTAHGAHQRAR